MPKKPRFIRIFCVLLLGLVPVVAAAAEDTLMLLYTNDIHDHLRPGYEEQGGLPYVAGHVKAVRAARNDTLLLDAGDVMEKGDMLPAMTKSEAMYEAMSHIGYDAMVPGNHDVKIELSKLVEYRDRFNVPFLCANILNSDGTTLFPPARVFDVDGVKVGVIGITRSSKRSEIPNFKTTTEILAREAARLEPEAHIVIALVHESVNTCMQLSRAVPSVDVFVGGHAHEALTEPRVVQETGALIVEAGHNADYVGELALTIDLEARRVAAHEGRLVSLDHATTPRDESLSEWIVVREQAVCPEASKPVGPSDATMGPAAVSYLVAEAMRVKTGAEIALSMTDQVVRNSLPKGNLDINALFRVLAPGVSDIVEIDLRGADLLAYISEYAGGMERPQWVGARIGLLLRPRNGSRIGPTSIDRDKVYRVAMTRIEWEKRLSRFMKDHTGAFPPIKTCPAPLIDVFAEYLSGVLKEPGASLTAIAQRLDTEARGTKRKMPAEVEPKAESEEDMEPAAASAE